jgi:hypothetical protein
MKNVGVILQGDHLVQLVQEDNFVGWVYQIDYTRALVMTNDLWKARALGVPHNCFLLAASFHPKEFQKTRDLDREVLLLRVIGSSRLPQDDDLVRTKIDSFQQQTEKFLGPDDPDFDDITRNQLQFGGLECRVLGTFYSRDGELWLGSDLESFACATRLNVYRPRRDALGRIVNHIDPLRRRAAEQEAQLLGIKQPIAPFRVGTVRYTSADRMHRGEEEEKVPVYIQPSDLLARRTAVLGMTRTGKSNMVKQMVSVVKKVADEGGVKIGQIIYDINGEYANATQQDLVSIADVYPTETVRYRMLDTVGFRMLQNNFYLQMCEGFAIIRRVLEERKNDTGGDVQVFLNTSFDEPDQQDISAHNRWEVRVAAYQAMLHKAYFPVPAKDQNDRPFRIKFSANEAVREAVEKVRVKKGSPSPSPLKNPSSGLTPDEAVEWFLAVREANKESKGGPLSSSSGKDWLDDDTVAILNMMANKNTKDTYIRGYKVLLDAKPYHSHLRSQEVGDEIYQLLVEGKIVILDLSVGDPTLRDRVSRQIAQDIFNKSMSRFVKGQVPPNVVIYIEEAHNLIGKESELTDTWPRVAKEGAKYRIALIYATQEVSSVHPNILANTENWFITHLNNEREVKELARFYDFGDFSQSLIRAQDVGFARVKTLSSPYVVPVQIDKFAPQANAPQPTVIAPDSAGPEPAPITTSLIDVADDIPF